jgi:hypothetical protein
MLSFVSARVNPYPQGCLDEGPGETQTGYGSFHAVGTLHLRPEETVPLRHFRSEGYLPLRR